MRQHGDLIAVVQARVDLAYEVYSDAVGDRALVVAVCSGAEAVALARTQGFVLSGETPLVAAMTKKEALDTLPPLVSPEHLRAIRRMGVEPIVVVLSEGKSSMWPLVGGNRLH